MTRATGLARTPHFTALSWQNVWLLLQMRTSQEIHFTVGGSSISCMRGYGTCDASIAIIRPDLAGAGDRPWEADPTQHVGATAQMPIS
jgi:hypothetical protein